MQIKHGELVDARAPVARRNYLALVALTCGSLAMCGFVQEVTAQEEPGRFRDSKDGFSFVPPTGWERSTHLPNPQLRFMFLGPTQRIFRANVNLIVDKDSGETFDDCSKQMKELYPTLFSSWKLAEEGPIEIGGKAAYCLSYTYRMGAHTLRGVQFIIRGGNGKFYILTFTLLNDAFERLKHTVVQSAMTVRIE